MKSECDLCKRNVRVKLPELLDLTKPVKMFYPDSFTLCAYFKTVNRESFWHFCFSVN